MSHVLIAGQRRHLGGVRRQLADPRDHLYRLAQLDMSKVPPQFLDMRPRWQHFIGIYDQGDIGSCTANGSIACFRWVYSKAGILVPNFSRLAQYAWTRSLEGTPLTDDSGASIRSAVKTLHQMGACDESLWGYDTSLYYLNPPPECRTDAVKHESLSYHPLFTLDDIRQQAANWYPVVFGFECPASLQSEETARTGIIQPFQPGEESIGGHCMAIIGYCDTRQALLCANSWGEAWGDGGFAWLPYEYVTNGKANDFWVIHTAEGVTFGS